MQAKSNTISLKTKWSIFTPQFAQSTRINAGFTHKISVLMFAVVFALASKINFLFVFIF